MAKNGDQKAVEIVAKNVPFQIELSIDADAPFNFHQLHFGLQLVYDCPDEKQVDYIKYKPLEFRLLQIEKQGFTATFEIRIKVLSSQLEDMCFKLRFILSPYKNTSKGNQSKELVVDSGKKNNIIITTPPIRTVSKPDQAKLKSRPTGTRNNNKRSRTEALYESLEKVQSEQKQQLKILKNLIDKKAKAVNKCTSSIQPVKEVEKNTSVDFEQAFTRLLDAFSKVEEEERPRKIQKLTNITSPSSLISLLEFVELVRYEERMRSLEDSLFINELLSEM